MYPSDALNELKFGLLGSYVPISKLLPRLLPPIPTTPPGGFCTFNICILFTCGCFKIPCGCFGVDCDTCDILLLKLFINCDDAVESCKLCTDFVC